MMLICEECKKPFKTDYKKKYCSRECYKPHLRTNNQNGENNTSWMDIIKLEELDKLYNTEQKSLGEIAQIKDCSRTLIRKRLKLWKIPIRSYAVQVRITSEQGKIRYRGLKGTENPAYRHGNLIGQKENRKRYLTTAKEHLKWKCEMCGKKNTNETFDLIVHHKDKNNKNNIVTNLQILCQGCHARKHNLGGKHYETD